MRINSSLLREKFTIQEKLPEDDGSLGHEVRACSNRMVLNLEGGSGLIKESFVVRTDSMHLCARVSGQILSDYENRGPFTPRLKKIKWDLIWDTVLSDYEKRYNQKRWVTIYYKGKPVYISGEHHSFLDIIEQFEATNERNTYKRSLRKAEIAFQKAGKDVTIDYASNVALVIDMDRTGGRCSTILRSPDRTTAFHYSIKPQKDTEKVVISQGLTSAGDFLEGINLSYFIGITRARIKCGQIEKFSKEAEQMHDAHKHLEELAIKISSLENRYTIYYRPERPEFNHIITRTEHYTEANLLNNSDTCFQ